MTVVELIALLLEQDPYAVVGVYDGSDWGPEMAPASSVLTAKDWGYNHDPRVQVVILPW